jgi:hypothetical protein
MPKLSHVEAFEFFSEGTQDEIRDYIAFGLFMRSENAWASAKSTPLTEADYRRYHSHILTTLERERFRNGAIQVLDNFAARAIQTERADLLRHHRKFRWLGIVEGVLGAFFWTLLLIVITIVAERAGIDLLEYYKRAAGLH